MRYKEFRDTMRDLVAEKMGEDYEITLHSVLKNNSVKYRGMIIRKKGVAISPTIYLETFFERNKSGESLEDLCDEIIASYKQLTPCNAEEFMFFNEYELVKPHLCLKLINFKENSRLLEKVPHFRFLDLAAVPYCSVEGSYIGNASILIYKSHLKRWKKSEAELLEDARENTRRTLGVEIKSLVEIANEMNPAMSEGLDDTVLPPMYVLSNKLRCYGAINIIFDDVLNEFASLKGCDFYVLPSSVHEVLLLGTSSDEEWDAHDRMVREVNRTAVAEEEVLSDHAYYYSREKGILLSKSAYLAS